MGCWSRDLENAFVRCTVSEDEGWILDAGFWILDTGRSEAKIPQKVGMLENGSRALQYSLFQPQVQPFMGRYVLAAFP